MKQKLIVTTLAICIVAIGSLTANANQRHGGGYGPQSMEGPESSETDCRSQKRGPEHGMFAALLDLTEEQQEKIEAIRQAGRTANETLREKKQEYQRELRDLVDEGSFDEEAIRAIAEQKAAVEVELAISRAKTHNETLAIMTPEQQELAKKLRAARQNNRGQHHKGRGGRWQYDEN